MYKGRRDWVVQGLLGLAATCAVFQSLINARELHNRFQVDFDGGIVALLCLAAIVLVMFGVRVRRTEIPAGVVVAIGTLTYPLYLLHQQIGYIAFERLEPFARPSFLFVVIVAALVASSWATAKYVERPGQRLLKYWLFYFAELAGLSVHHHMSSRDSAAHPTENKFCVKGPRTFASMLSAKID
jgi:peptidoglycan/LPS O-acetylase OafA/YrhL